jgi:predicted DNA-binding ribbon-helix-helix protein
MTKEVGLTDEAWATLSEQAKKRNLTVQQLFDREILPGILKTLGKDAQ